jgi:hypothetical protein
MRLEKDIESMKRIIIVRKQGRVWGMLKALAGQRLAGYVETMEFCKQVLLV